MKKLLILFALFLTPIIYAQTYKLYQTNNINNQLRINTITGEVYQIQNDGQRFLVHAAVTSETGKSGRYKLFKTENMWTFILLDRYTGKLWQCQFSVEGTEYIASWVINSSVLSTTEKSKFTIEPQTSMFQFYLLNEDTGDMWKFQWSTKSEEGYRWIEKF